ncbi:secretory calcium-binding phosphoprotein 9 isoform X2 [Hippoglossus hippoglossus]|uniref:secretory calcium-binding phosphoprotein 9 isoform X2 n=1 Tax=Hippoglossus hippoglossus TaxID=8267 RepID=UPI00148B9F8F|nr:secretory calcium-binding phosphoprotein 9 isoform X2 [Hippoglossus hippoglossus]
MKLLLLTTALVATICYVSAGKTQKLIAAMNAGLIPGMNGGVVNGVNPGMMAGGLNPAMVAGGGVGFIRQPQFAQAPVPNMYPVPAVNTFPFMGVPQMAQMNPAQQPFMGVPQMAQMNPAQQPFMGVPQMAQMNPAQQPFMVNTGGAVPQQFPLQPDPLRRFRRQIMKQDDNMKTTMDTQIPAPTEKATAALCDDHDQHQDV